MNRQPNEASRELLTVVEVGELLNTGERYVRRLIDERRIEFVRIGRKVRVPRSAVDALIERGRVQPRRAA